MAAKNPPDPHTPVDHAQFVIERDFDATPEQVFAAFAQAKSKLQWFVGEDDWERSQHQLDFRVGGRETSMRGKPGAYMRNDTYYFDIVPDRRIVMSYSMSFGETPFSVSLTTIELSAKGRGTRMRFVENIARLEGADPLAMRQQGWNSLLERLASTLPRA